MSGAEVIAAIIGIPLACDLVLAFVKPLKNHKLCGGRGLDPYCNYSGKVPRFGARLVRPSLRRQK